jgi:putative flavoprotein involved in K+ transport
LPGTPFPAPAGTHPTKDEVADYLARYAREHDLPVQLNTRVTRLSHASGRFVASAPTGELCARQVVVATGPFQTPRIPSSAAQLAPDVPQLHSAHYRNAAQLPSGAHVLVVGSANSGLQIAADLAASHAVTVAVGSRPPQLPQRFLARDLFSWFDGIGFLRLSATGRLGRRVRARGDIVIGTRTAELRRAGVAFRPRLTGFVGRTARFADGTDARVDAVVWATGYRSDYSWLDVPNVVSDAQVRHRGGVSEVPGLYFLGLPWQTTRGSSLLGFVSRDAATIARQLGSRAAVPAVPAVK